MGRAAFEIHSPHPLLSEADYNAIERDLARLKPEETGERIGHYKLLQQIGEGGFGTVWMAEQEQPVRRRVALKIIKLGMDTKDVIARFEQERQALAMMDHPNIAKVFDAGATQYGRPYFVMELVQGIKITDYCDQANLPTAERLALFIQTCSAVQHAHQKGIIHRDIKPSNVLVMLHDNVPVPKVIDFGVAKATQSARLTDLTLFTQFEQMIGTPLYMSPEQAEMTGLDVDTRSDIYSLGVLLYELLTGRTPFDPEELMRKGYDEIRRAIREQEPQTPSMFLKTMADETRATVAQHRQSDPAKLTNLIRGDLDWIVMKALEKDRTRRYETATGLARDIERHLADEPVLARPPSSLYRFRRFVKRHKLGFTAASLVATALIVGFGISIWSLLKEKEARQRAVASEREAATAATRSEQVAQLLQDMLKGVGPQVALGKNTDLLHKILDDTAARVSKDLKGQPAVEAELRETLGGVYYDLGDFQKAEQMFGAALRLNQSLNGRARQEVIARLLNQLGATLTELGRLTEAQTICTDALAQNKTVHGQVHGGVATSLHHLGEVLRLRHDLVPAEARLREAFDQWKQLHAERQPAAALTLNDLGLVVQERGDIPQAERLFKDAQAIREEHFGKNHPFVSESLNNVGLLLWYQGRLDEAEEKHTQALSVRQEVLGENHPSVANSCNNLALVLRDRGKLVEAEAMQRRALSLVKEALGESHPYTIQTRNNLAIVLRRRSAPSGDLAVLREALQTNPVDVLTADAMAAAFAIPSLGSALSEQNGSTPWRYTSIQPEPNWFELAFRDNAWPSDPPLRGASLVLPRTPKTPITRHIEIWLRREFQLSSLPSGKLLFRIGSNQDAEVFINGVAAAATADWSDADVLVPCRDDARAALTVGRNVLAVHCEDTDGGMPIDVRLYTTLDPTFGRSQVIEEFNRMIDKDAKRAELYAGRADAFARLGRWEDTVSDLQRARKLQPSDSLASYYLAPVLVHSGDLSSYRKCRSEVLDQFASEARPIYAERVSRLALLLPADGSELEAAVQLAEVGAAAQYPLGLAWRQLTKGLAEYRAGRFASAVAWIQRTLSTNGQKNLPGWTHERQTNCGATAFFIRAMAHQQLKQTAKASEAFDTGVKIIRTQFSPASSGDIGREWPDRLIALIFQREADALIHNSSTTTGERK